jgi:hypothetical protein
MLFFFLIKTDILGLICNIIVYTKVTFITYELEITHQLAIQEDYMRIISTKNYTINVF